MERSSPPPVPSPHPTRFEKVKTLDAPISQRKQDHLDLCLEGGVESVSGPDWDHVRLPHRALPEIDWAEVDLSADLLGKRYRAPLMISSMTGGSEEGERLNLRLAEFAGRKNIPMGVGSLRVALENREYGFFSSLRRAAPTASLFANIGAVQLNYGVSADDCQWMIDHIEADALILHCNPLQEAIQEEGDRDFSALFPKIERLRRVLSVPLILKETGCGIDAATAARALEAGVDVIDVGGRGGTHWGLIEGLRSPRRRALGEMFKDWGNGSAAATLACVKAVAGRVPVVASGGIRSGLDVARALHLGASFCGMALPFLKAADSGEEAMEDFWELHTEALRIALFCMGRKKISPREPGGPG